MLHIIVALHCEAKPIIEFYKLKKISDRDLPFPVFVSKDENIYLIVSGVGKVKTAIATTFLYTFTGSKSHGCFLNIGIAGSKQFSLGDCVSANKITENTTQRHWYPFVALLKNIKQTQLITHDIPQHNYPDSGMLDMEGSAFFQAATCFVSQEQVHVLKIISDNNEATLNQINQESVSLLISKNLSEITKISEYLLNLSTQEYAHQADPREYENFQTTWRFTYSQKVMLKEYLRRWQMRLSHQNPWEFCKDEKNPNQIIEKIMKRLDEHANCLY